MKTWQSISALKRVKDEIETLSANLGSALEAVIATPVGEIKQLALLDIPMRDFVRVSGTLRMLECPNLSLLAHEILHLLNDTIGPQAELDNKELEQRLEMAFVAVTDLPALLEYFLRESGDSFLYISQHVNRLRKARECAIIFSGSALLEKDEVDFRAKFNRQPEKMQALLAKQAEFYVKYSKALLKNPGDDRVLQLLTTVLGNLELMLRDHKIGVLWGLARGLADAYVAEQSDKLALAGCLQSLVPSAMQLMGSNAAAMQANIDETILERLINFIAGTVIESDRPDNIKLWYNLDIASGKAFRSDFRKLQVSYYNKEALIKSLRLINEDIRRLIEEVNALAEMPNSGRDRVKEIYTGINTLRDVLFILRMHYLTDIVDKLLPAEPAVDLEAALNQAAGVLFRIDKEVLNKLENMEREVFSSDRGIIAAETMNSGRLKILQTATASLETVITALDSHVEHSRQEEISSTDAASLPSGFLAQAHGVLDEVACVLNTLPLAGQAKCLVTAKDYLAWLLRQNPSESIDANFQSLSYLLINSSWYLEQLAMGRQDSAGGNLDLAAQHAVVLQQFLDTLPANLHVIEANEPKPAVRSKLFVIADTNQSIQPEPVLTPEAEDETHTTDNTGEESEIKIIFAEEFDEVLALLLTNHAALVQNPLQAQRISESRRAFHTLKGSGRMVGAIVIGQLAEAMEKLYEHAVDHSEICNAGFLNLSARVLAVLPELKQDFCVNNAVLRDDADIAALRSEARALLRDETLSAEVSPSYETQLSTDVQASTEAQPSTETQPSSEVQEEAVDESLLAVFLEEADELLQRLDALFLKWREAPQDNACVDEYLRLLHTIKGSAALVCEHEMSAAAHDHESFILDAQRNQRALDENYFIECDKHLHSLHAIYQLYHRDEDGHFSRSSLQIEADSTVEILAEVNPISESVQEAALLNIEAPEVVSPEPVEMQAVAPEEPQLIAESEPDITVLAALSTLVEPEEQVKAELQPTPPTPPAAPVSPTIQHENTQPPPDEQVRVSSKLLRSMLNDADEINFSHSRIEDNFHGIGGLLLDMDEILNRFLSTVKNFEQKAQTVSQLAATSTQADARQTEEFDALEMDRYTDLQELSLSLTEDYNDLQDIRVNLAGKVKDIDNAMSGQQRLTNSLQDGLISSQMVPFASVVPRLERLVRQISGKLKKQVRFEVTNQQGSLDKNILQAIISPLEHIVRNAIDHGIEAPEVRNSSGKQAQATLNITAARQGASFVIKISDDGQGIDVDKVMQQAHKKGLLAIDAVLSDEEAYRLLFQSGFSTSAALSSISGRGVGLDVVKSEIENIGGSVNIASSKNEGTTFFITLPLTSSLNRALLFEIQDTRYVVLMNTLDGVLVEKLASIHQKQQQQVKPVFEYGDKSYEYLYLGKLINESFKPRLDSIDNSIPLLLVSDKSRNFALHIDSIIESRDLVVKSFGQQFAAMPGIAGGVIMPDGNVAIVLDLKSLVNLYGKDTRPAIEVPMTLSGKGNAEKQRKLVMVVDDSITVRKVTTAILKRNGMDVITAKNGLEAVELLENTLPDLILLDIEMPKMDGFEVAAHIRAQAEPVCAIPIIMITSRIGEKHRSRAEEIGVNEYLCKPFEEANLLKSIHSF